MSYDENRRATALVAGQTSSEGADGTSLTIAAETSAAMTAERSKALIQAAYIVARQNPRDLMNVRQRILTRCQYGRFAEVAIYKKPQGKNRDGSENVVTGLSIRFAEAAVQAYGNIRVETNVLFDTAERRILEVMVIDLETNTTYSGPVAFEKTVERRKVGDKAKPIEIRTNTYGDPVYILRATDDEVRMKEAALTSKAIRNLSLRLIPGEILDEAREVIAETVTAEVRQDPGAAVRRMVDAFARGNVTAASLAEYLGHSLDIVTPDEILELKGVAQAIADKELTWREALAAKTTIPAEPASKPGEPQTPAPAPTGGNAAAAAWKAKRGAASPAPPPVAAGSGASLRQPGED